MKSFDRRVLSAVVLLLLVLAGLIFAGSQIGLPAPQLEDQSPGAYGPLTLVFSEPMQRDTVEARLRTEPEIEGQFTWAGETLSFWPRQALQPGQAYTVRLQAGVLGQSGRRLRETQSWQVRARSPQVAYLSPRDAPELWLKDLDGQNARQLTSTGGKVFDYHAARDGSRIVYAAQNAQKGMDLWEIDRQGQQPRLLLVCGTDWCVNPAYSPDGRQVAYSRRQVGSEDDTAPGAPHVWLLDLTGGSTEALFTDIQIGGFAPAWSPDGSHLAFFDGLNLGVRVVEMQNRTGFILDSETGLVGEWSPDGRTLLYIYAEAGEELPQVVVNQVDVVTRQVTRLLGEEPGPVDYSVPVWSPDGQWLAVSLRSLSGSASKQIWRMRPDGSQKESITSSALYTHAGCQWDPTGKRLVFQRLELGSSSARPQVLVWSEAGGETLVLAEDAFQPRWLP